MKKAAKNLDFERAAQLRDQIITLNENDSGFEKSGYSITSWNTKADGTGKTYLLGQSITLWNDLTLYAIWE